MPPYFLALGLQNLSMFLPHTTWLAEFNTLPNALFSQRIYSTENVKEYVIFTEYFVDQGGVDITCCSASGLNFSLSHSVLPSSHPNYYCCILVLLNLT